MTSLYDFKIDLDAFEQVLADDNVLSAFNARQGRALLAAIARFEARMRDLKVFEPCPTIDAIRAFQMTFHDNGPVRPPSNRSLKPRPTLTQYSLALKCWTRQGNISFGMAAQVAWEANAYLWTVAEARAVIEELGRKKLITGHGIQRMEEVIDVAAQSGFDDALFSIPMYRRRKEKGGNLKWFDRMVVMASIDSGKPQQAVVFHQDDGVIAAKQFSDEGANRKSFADLNASKAETGRSPNIAYQARIDLDGTHSDWSTETR